MQRTNSRPSLWRIITRDTIAGMTALFLGSIWLIQVVLLLSAEPWGKFTFFAFLTTLAAIPLLLRRIYFYRKLFSEGAEVAGKLIDISFSSDVGGGLIDCSLEYKYTFRDQTYKVKRTLDGEAARAVRDEFMRGALKYGDRIALLIDPAKPQRPLIRNLYDGETKTLLAQSPQDEPAPVFPTDEKSPVTIVTTIGDRIDKIMGPVGTALVVLMLVAAPVLFFYSYFSYEPLTEDQLTEVTGRVQRWTIYKDWPSRELHIRTSEHAATFEIPDSLFKKEHFDFDLFRDTVKPGEELIIAIRKENLEKTYGGLNVIDVYALSSKNHTYLPVESGISYDKSNHKGSLFGAIFFSLPILMVMYGWASGRLPKKEGTKAAGPPTP